jgi:hypothetical protein
MTPEERAIIERLIEAAENVCLSETVGVHLELDVLAVLETAIDEARMLLEETDEP